MIARVLAGAWALFALQGTLLFPRSPRVSVIVVGVLLVLAGVALRWPRGSLLLAAGAFAAAGMAVVLASPPSRGAMAAAGAIAALLALAAWYYGRQPSLVVAAVVVVGVVNGLHVGVRWLDPGWPLLGVVVPLIVAAVVVVVLSAWFDVRVFRDVGGANPEIEWGTTPRQKRMDDLLEAGFTKIATVGFPSEIRSLKVDIHLSDDGTRWCEVGPDFWDVTSSYGHRRLATSTARPRQVPPLPRHYLRCHATGNVQSVLAAHDRVLEHLRAFGEIPDLLDEQAAVEAAVEGNQAAGRFAANRSILDVLKDLYGRRSPAVAPSDPLTDEDIRRWVNFQ